jgi:hypothetical protein
MPESFAMMEELDDLQWPGKRIVPGLNVLHFGGFTV